MVTYFQTCQRCNRCRGGQPNLCDNAYEFFGKQPEWPHFHAAFSTHYYVHPRQHFYKVSDDVDDAIGAGANCRVRRQQVGAGVGGHGDLCVPRRLLQQPKISAGGIELR